MTRTDWTERYRYDPAGNLVQDDARLRYDPQGRVVTRQRKRLSAKPDTSHYEWDADDRMTAVTRPDGTRWRYRYDPFGRRVAKLRLAADGETVVEQVDFTWDGTVLAEQNRRQAGGPDLATTWDYDPDTFRPLVQLEQDQVDQRFYAIVTDLVGTPTELVAPSGDIAWRSRSTVWGRAEPMSGTAATPLRFPGRYHDVETGLNYNYFRYYDPDSARYHSADPIGLLGGPNPHAYVANPLTWLDPLGLKCSRGEMEAMMRSQKIAPDLLDKGVHVNVNVKNKKFELRAAPTNEGGVVLKPVNPKMARDHPQLYEEALRKGQGALEYPEFRDWLSKHAEKGAEMATTSSQSRHWGKVREFNGL